MPLPPITEQHPIDLIHLRRMTLGDSALERQVLAMFLTQADRLLRELGALSSDAGALAHTLKGSARAVGAFGVADQASALEDAIRHGGDIAPPLAALDAAISAARTAVETLLDGP